jgi:hypothetical protein
VRAITQKNTYRMIDEEHTIDSSYLYYMQTGYGGSDSYGGGEGRGLGCGVCMGDGSGYS